MTQKTYTQPREGGKRFVARLIKEARFARGLTPTEAANAIGISRAIYYSWERGNFGNSAAKVVCWLLQDAVDAHDPAYWRERALLAERALSQQNEILKRYAAGLRALRGDDESEPSSVAPREGSRVRAA
jgi:transcriptional regulator with XRE-family HTH domain